MQRILNDPDNIVEEMLEGFMRVHADIVEKTGNPRAIRSRAFEGGRVGVVTGGGSGHKPAFIGFCGKGMVDAVAVGEICSSPTAQAFLDAFVAADGGKGVACLYGNYSGDNMNVKMAVKMAKRQVAKILDAKKISIYKSYVGNYLTSMDMMGASLTITKLDDELKQMLDMPAYTMGFCQE